MLDIRDEWMYYIGQCDTQDVSVNLGVKYIKWVKMGYYV